MIVGEGRKQSYKANSKKEAEVWDISKERMKGKVNSIRHQESPSFLPVFLKLLSPGTPGIVSIIYGENGQSKEENFNLYACSQVQHLQSFYISH